MTAVRRSVEWILYGTLIALAVVDVVLFAYVTHAKRELTISATLFRDQAAEYAGVPPDGYVGLSSPVPIAAATGNGWVVRYSTPTCIHCKADEARWSQLKASLLHGGYKVYEIPPTSHDSYAVGAPELNGEMQIPFVDVAWMAKYRLTGTPTTLLFNRHGQILWTQVGEMNQDEQKTALQVLARSASGQP